MQREMIDLLERLRDELTINDGIRYYNADIIREAADEIKRLQAALKLAGVALNTAECVIDADGEVEAFHQVQTAHKAVKAVLEGKP